MFQTLKESGWGLLEAVVALAIMLVLLMMAIPGFHHLIERNRASSVINGLTQAIYFSRNEAIKQGQSIQFCGSGNGRECDGQWSKGQLVVAGNDHQVLRQLPSMPAGYSLIWRSNLGQNTALTFVATGFTAGQNGSFYYCPANHSAYDLSQFGAIIVVSDSGRLRVDHDQDNLTEVCQTVT